MGREYVLNATHGGHYGTRGTEEEEVLHAKYVETSRIEQSLSTGNHHMGQRATE